MQLRTRVLTLVLLLVLLAASPFAAQEQASPAGKKPLTIEGIFSGGGLTGRMPTQLRWSPDGTRLSYILRGDEGRRDLWVIDVKTGEKRVLVSYEQLSNLAPSPEQATTDERERTRLTRYAVAAYRWAPDGKAILFTSSGQLYLYDLASGKAQPLAPAKRGLRDPKFSPDGDWLSFVYEHDLWLVPAAGGKERQLTRGGNQNLLHGDLDWVYPEEFGLRTGYHWSPDSRHIAFLESDQTAVPTYPLTDEVALNTPVDFQRYPKAGDPNPRVRVGIVAVETGKTAWLDRAAEYIPRIQWADAEHVAVQLLNRGQTELELVLADAGSGRSRSVFFERDPHWLNISNDLLFLSNGEEFLWTSERTGFRHIYRYRRDGQLVRQLTSGEWEVQGLEGVDEEGGWLYYASRENNVLGNDLYRIKLDGSGKQRVTQRKGTHGVTMNPAATAYTDFYSALDKVPELSLRNLANGKRVVIHAARSVDGYDLVTPEPVELKAPDGGLIRVMLLKPHKLAPGKKLPVVVYVYGMAGVPTIRDAWGRSRYLFHQYLVQQGYVVAYFDDRASSIRGHKHEVAAYRNLGPTALADYRVGVEWLRSLPFVDAERIAVWGWSGGGFSTSFALTHSDLFKVGIAVAPVTDWRLYDSIYTERYMGLPQEETEAYDRTSAVKAAENLHGRLLLMHGTADDNVHPQNTIQLVDALIKAGQQFDLMLYPGKTHGITGAVARTHLFRYFVEYLKNHL